jgi:CIC family chloride channel protein
VSRILDRLQPSETLILVVTSLLVGVLAGLAAIVFRWLIQEIHDIAFVWFPAALAQLPAPLTWLSTRGYLALTPAIGGLLVGILVYRFAREAKGSGIPEVMESVALHAGYIRPIVILVKPLASALTIGTGGSAGREGPIVHTASALGSALGQLLRLSDDRVRHLVACGAAGGIAATFNTPIAGVLFALEVILGEFSVANFGPVVLAAVVASVVGHAAFGDVPAFLVPEYSIRSLWEFPMYAGLGFAAALVAVAFVRLLYWVSGRFDSWTRVRPWVKPAIGGAMVGLLALAYGPIPGLFYEDIPPTFSVGYETVDAALRGQLLLGTMLGWMVLKIVATSITLGSGGSGGVFAPALFIGSLLGGVWGNAMAFLFPDTTAPAGAYALVGMGAVFAGASHAPITAVITLFELTGNYLIILPLMLAVTISTALAQTWLKGESIYTLKLVRRGVRLSRGRDVDVMEGVLVQEAMTRQCDVVPTTMTLEELNREFRRTEHHGFPVMDEAGKLFGIVTVQDLKRALERGTPTDTLVQEIAVTKVIVAYPDEPMADALHRLSVRGVGRLPVVLRDDPQALVGTVRRSDIIRAYNIALTRRAEVQQRAERVRLRKVDHTEFLELELAPRSPCVGRTVRELASLLPHDLVLVSIRRANGQVIIPHGDTEFRPGDRITAFADQDAVTEAKRLFLGESPHEHG